MHSSSVCSGREFNFRYSLHGLNKAHLWSRVDNKTNGKVGVHQSASSQQDLEKDRRSLYEVSWTDLGGGQGCPEVFKWFFAVECE